MLLRKHQLYHFIVRSKLYRTPTEAKQKSLIENWNVTTIHHGDNDNDNDASVLFLFHHCSAAVANGRNNKRLYSYHQYEEEH